MTLGQNGVLRHSHFSDFFGDKMANLGPINYKIVFYIKVNVNEGQNKFEVHILKRLAKMSINWHRINQMPLLCVNIWLRVRFSIAFPEIWTGKSIFSYSFWAITLKLSGNVLGTIYKLFVLNFDLCLKNEINRFFKFQTPENSWPTMCCELDQPAYTLPARTSS